VAQMLAPETAVLRLFNVYGPGQTGPYAGVVSKFIKRAKRGLSRSSTATRPRPRRRRRTGLGGESLYAPPRPGDIRHSAADVSKARALGWEPQIPLEEGLRRLWTLTSSLR